jgi:3-hydroxybutyryl-CoA dehydrogenase
VGVVGCGVMGSGIAQICAQANYQVLISDVDNERINKGLDTINRYLSKSIEKGKLTNEEKNAALARIKFTTSNNRDLNDCDLVIEAVFEDLDLKKKIFMELDKYCAPQAILVTNTSSLSVTDIASRWRRSEHRCASS